MRKRLGLVLLASLTMSSVLLVAGPSSAAAVSTPKGKVYVGIETNDPDQSANVVVIGEGSNPVPFILIDYNAGNCKDAEDNRLPIILTGWVNVSAADEAGKRVVTNDGEMRFQCTNADRFVLPWDVELEYDSKADTLGGHEDWATLSRACNGTNVPGFNTVIGDSGRNELIGTSGMDLLDGRGGGDTLRGKGGHDILCGGNGNDVLKGGAGIDLLFGADGRDKLFGDNGFDVLLGGDNPKAKKREPLEGGAGWDVIYGWLGRDLLVGGGGSDHLYGGPGSDKLKGGPGSDTCLDKPASTFKSCEDTG
ncbi:MAG: calcium-binding protein [bacterium]|nr:calcium-binding protein [bacterium]